MSRIEVESVGDLTRPERSGWHELWRKEDWWAIWLGLAIVIVGYLLFATGASLRWVAVTPAKWSSLGQLAAHFGANIWRYVVQLLPWLAVFTPAVGSLGGDFRDRPMVGGGYLQPGAAPGGARRGSGDFQSCRLAALVRRGLSCRVLHQARHCAFGGNAPPYPDRLGRADCAAAGVDRLDCNLPRHLSRQRSPGAGSSPGSNA